MRRGLALLAALLALLGLAAWFIPPALDASRHRALLENVASTALGGAVRIEGKIAFTLLPSPAITATNASLSSPNLSTPNLSSQGAATLRAEELHLRLSPLALLLGRVETRDLVLTGADITLDWHRTLSLRGGEFWDHRFTARIEHGRLTAGDITWRDLFLTLERTEDQTITFSGRGRFETQDWSLQGRLRQPERGDGLTLTLNAAAGPSTLTLTGTRNAEGHWQTWLTARAPDLSRWLPAPALPLRLEGPLVIANNTVTAKDWSVTLANAAARLDATWHFGATPRLEFHARAPRLELDPWLDAGAIAIPPPTLPITGHVSIGAANLRGGTIRQMEADLQWSNTTLTLNTTAMLPGDTELAAAGQLATTPTRAFTGEIRLATLNPRASLAWAEAVSGQPFPQPPPGTLTGATLTTRAHITAEQTEFTAVTGTLDGARLTGEVRLRHAGKPRIQAKLNWDRLQLDPWFATPPRDFANLSLDLQLTAETALLAGETLRDTTADFAITDSMLTLRRAQLHTAGLRAEASFTLAADGTITDGRLDLTAPTGSPLPSRLLNLPREGREFWDAPLTLRAEFQGPEKSLQTRLGGEIGDLRLESQQTLDLPSGLLTGTISLRHPGARRLLAESGLLPRAGPTTPGDWPGEGSLSLQTNYSLLTKPNGTKPGLTLETFDLTAGPLRGTGQLALDWAGETPNLTGTLTLETLPLPSIPHAAEPTAAASPPRHLRANLHLTAKSVLATETALAENLSCQLALADTTLRLHPCTFHLAGGTVALNATLHTSPPRLTLDATLDGANPRDLPWPAEWPPLPLSGTTETKLRLTATGTTPPALANSAQGSFTLIGRDLTLHSLDLTEIESILTDPSPRPIQDITTALRTALTQGASTISHLALNGSFSNGQARLTRGHADGPTGSLAIAGTMDLASTQLDLRLTTPPGPTGQPSLGLTLTGPLATPSPQPDLLALLRWLTTRP